MVDAASPFTVLGGILLPMADDIPPEIRRLPAEVRRQILDRAGGDWSRVTVEAGVITVHNRPQQDGVSKAEEPPQAPPEQVEPPSDDPPPVALPRRPRPPRSPAGTLDGIPFWPAITPALPLPPGAEPPEEEPAPPVTLAFLAPGEEQPPPVQLPRTRPLVSSVPPRFARPEVYTAPPAGPSYCERPGTGNHDPLAYGGSASELAHVVASGIGPGPTLLIQQSVVDLGTIDLDTIENIVRYADRVEVDGSSATRRYPALRFFRGGAMIVVGFRERSRPMVLAAYIRGGYPGRQADPPVAMRSSAPASERPPSKPEQLLPRLEDLGAAHEELGPTTVNVLITFKGVELGRVNIGPTATRASVQSDYLRMKRKIEAIKRDSDRA